MHSVLVAAPVSASVAVLFAGAPLLPTYTLVFMPALGRFIVAANLVLSHWVLPAMDFSYLETDRGRRLRGTDLPLLRQQAGPRPGGDR
ncbi:hypothetical protein ACR80S_03875 [Halomonas sp. MA07-2]|uniref:hypothetical protein n=1 Tax=Halomonas sp. RA08-2 TaxID=3440842 RepID=UPI003EEC14E6